MDVLLVILVQYVLVQVGQSLPEELPCQGDTLLDCGSSTLVNSPIHSSSVLAKKRVGEAIPVVVRLASVA